MRALLSALLFAALWVAVPADAHKPSDSFLTVQVDGERVTGRWDIALRDLDYALVLDANGDGALTWDEVRRRHADIAAYALARLELASCRPAPNSSTVMSTAHTPCCLLPPCVLAGRRS
jgi:hypothetical protein